VNPITSADGTIVRCFTDGSGPPLLLVHGTTADHARWQMITPELAEHFTVYAMDRRGRGDSTDGPEYHLLREAEDVAAVVSAVLGAADHPGPFVYRDKGSMATIGRHAAVAELPNGWRLGGPLGWAAWLGLHLVMLIGFRNRANVLVNWTWNYLTFDRGSRVVVPSADILAAQPETQV